MAGLFHTRRKTRIRPATAAVPRPRRNPDLIAQIASDAVLEEAYRWLCARRTDYAPDADVWRLRWRWAEVKPHIQAQLRAGAYRLGAVSLLASKQ